MAGVLVTLFGVARAEQNRDAARDEVEFGILAAQHGLWREAAFRFERAIELDRTYAAAFNKFIVMFSLQTAGILERLYLFGFSRRKSGAAT
jgi:hypothetical protein